MLPLLAVPWLGPVHVWTSAALWEGLELAL